LYIQEKRCTKGIFPLVFIMKRKFDVKLRKVGNSYVVTIPKDTVDRFELKEGDFIALTFDSTEIKKENDNPK